MHFLSIVIFGLFILFVIIGGIWGAINPNNEKRTNVNVYVPPQPYQPPAPRQINQVNDWVGYAMRNPQVKLEVVETMNVANGQFVAEKHMRMSGPVPQIDPMSVRVVVVRMRFPPEGAAASSYRYI